MDTSGGLEECGGFCAECIKTGIQEWCYLLIGGMVHGCIQLQGPQVYIFVES